MTGLPVSLSIALWLTGALWLVGLLIYAFDGPSDIVWAALVVGLLTGVAEWLAHRRNQR